MYLPAKNHVSIVQVRFICLEYRCTNATSFFSLNLFTCLFYFVSSYSFFDFFFLFILLQLFILIYISLKQSGVFIYVQCNYCLQPDQTECVYLIFLFFCYYFNLKIVRCQMCIHAFYFCLLLSGLHAD